MPRMIDLVRSSAVPANLMQAAARGALSVPPAEMIEILVHLANHNKVFGQLARMTLAGWDEKSSLTTAADPSTPREVLDYYIAPENLRPKLLPVLLENSSIGDEALLALASSGTREAVDAMLQSSRVQATLPILNALASNPNVTPSEASKLHSHLQAAGFESATHDGAEQAQSHAPEGSSEGQRDESDEILETYLVEHHNEIAAEGEKPFQPIGGFYEDVLENGAPGAVPSTIQTPTPIENTETPPVVAETTVATAPTLSAIVSGTQAGAAHEAAPAKHLKKTYLTHDEERGSALQKISRLDIKGRIQLAMKGTKEERSILVRDGTKLVALAVLESPKITDGEGEKFASQKNVLEAVLRHIPLKRRFMKNYIVVRNLVANPRTPLDLSLGLMKNILIGDLRNLSSNKEVSETIRKLALKMFKQKKDPTKKSTD